MRGQSVIDWRTIQMFLSEDGVSEVLVDNENPTKMKCTCPQFEAKASCKHTKYIKSHMVNNKGHYTVLVPQEVDEDIVTMAMQEQDSMRDFIINYARVVVL
jgi:hypothetical protein